LRDPLRHSRARGPSLRRRMIEPLSDLLVEPVVRMALAEDLGRAGRVTAQACLPGEARMSVVWASRQDGTIAGLAAARLALAALVPTARFERVVADGTKLSKGAVLAKAEGNARAMLPAERTGLNLLG